MTLRRTLRLASIFAILACGRALAADPIEPTGDAPLYELRNLRTETDSLGRLQLAIDFRRTRAGKGSIFVSGKSGSGYLSIAAPVSSVSDSGTIRLTSLLPSNNNRKLDIELYLVQFHNWGEGGIHYAMVSNPVRLGDPGAATKPRAWTAEETTAYQTYLRVQADPNAKKMRKSYPVSIEAPDDSAFVPAEAKLVPGTKLEACWSGKWNPLTTLSENDDGSINVRWDDFGPDYDCSMVREELIIKKETLRQLGDFPIDPFVVAAARDSDPAKPRKSYPVTIDAPRDSQFVPSAARLPGGVKLQACWSGKWNPITLLAENGDGSLTVRWDDFGPAFDCIMERKELIIKKGDLRKSQMLRLKSAGDAAKLRTWSDAAGRFSTSAKLVGRTMEKVYLVNEAGAEIIVPLAELSEADQKLIAAARFE